MLPLPLTNFHRHISQVTFLKSVLHHSPVDVIVYVLFGRKVASIVSGRYFLATKQVISKVLPQVASHFMDT